MTIGKHIAIFLGIMLFTPFISGMLIPGCFESHVTPVPRPAPREIIQEGPVKLVFVGDIMMSRNVSAMIENNYNGDYGFLFDHVEDYLNQADIAFGNLESVISNLGLPNKIKGAPLFRANPSAVDALVSAGFDILSVANNHCFDYGAVAMEDSFNTLRRNGIQDVGGGFKAEEAYAPVIFAVKNNNDETIMKIAYLALNAVADTGYQSWIATSDGSGIAWATTESMEKAVYMARSLADVVIVSLHFGTQYETLPKNKVQDDLAHLAIDRGADLVIGHHPHVVQPVMSYSGKYIVYSLGNFIFDRDGDLTREGMVVEVILQDKEIVEITPKCYTINSLYQPEFNGKSHCWVE